MAEKITVVCECKACGGTGLFVSWMCHDGAAQVCTECEGTGKKEFSYVPFTKKKELEGIKRVFPNTPWHHLYPDDHTYDDGTKVEFSKCGCTYEEWKNGVTPKPVSKPI